MTLVYILAFTIMKSLDRFSRILKFIKTHTFYVALSVLLTAGAFTVFAAVSSKPLPYKTDNQILTTGEWNAVVETVNPIHVTENSIRIAGNVTATKFLHSSDRSLKTEISPIQASLEKVMNLSGVSFKWKDSNKSNIGLIAQDTEEIFPEVVSTDSETGLKSIDYAALVAPLIESIKEQQKQIEELSKKIERLESQN